MVVRFTADIAQLTAGAAAAKDEVAGFGSSAGLSGGLAIGALVGVGAAIVGVGVASVKMAADYEQAMNKVKALTGSTTTQMNEYDAGLKKLATDAGVAPKQLADGLYNVISAGYQGKDALKVLTLATEDAKIGMTDAGTTTNALTKVLADFKLKTQDAARANGIMLETVTLGNSTFPQYASQVTRAASVAAQFHVSLETMSAAWATMTAKGLNAKQATTDFGAVVTTMYGKVETMSKSLAKNGIEFNTTAFNAMSFSDKIKYMAQVLDIATAKHVQITGVTKQSAEAITKLSQNMSTYTSDLATLSNHQEMAKKTQDAWATTQAGFNQSMDRVKASLDVLMITIGNQLLPTLTQIASAVTPVISAFTQWLTNANNAKLAIAIVSGVLVGLAVVILSIVVPAFVALAASTIEIWGPVLLIGAVIGALTAVFIHFYQTSAPFRAFMGEVGAIFQQIGAFIAAAFVPVWKQLVDLWQSQLLPLLKELWADIQPLMPVFEGIAIIIAGIVVVAFGVFIALLTATIGAVSGFISGLRIVIHGLVEIFSGTFQTIGGIISFFVDLFTGKWSKLGGDLATIGHGIVTTFHGMWDLISGLFLTAWYTISGYVSGFIHGIIGYFTQLFNAIVGHSIIPDLINSIINWFAQLPGRMVQFGVNMVQGLINGIQSMFGAVGNTMSNLVSTIGSFLPHSPAKQGELRNLDAYGPNLVKGITSGIDRSSPILTASLTHLVQPAGGLAAAGAGSASAGAGGGQTIIIELDSKQLSRTVLTQMDKQVRLKVGNRSTRVA